MEQINIGLEEKYRRVKMNEVRFERVMTEDADVLVVAYGLSARVAHRGIELAREEGIRAGLLRPITLFPFPYDAIRELAGQVEGVLVVEMNAGQMIEDVRLAVEGRTPVSFHGRMGGIIPSPEEVLEKIRTMVPEKATVPSEAE